jgi:hypothetical protein
MQNMQVWPVDYPRPVTLMAFGLVALTAYVFYRFSFALLGLCLVTALRNRGPLDPGDLATRRPPARRGQAHRQAVRTATGPAPA